VTRPSEAQFRRLAKYYDALNDSKDYRGESARLEFLVRRFGRLGRTTWLDVACGTGRHLEHLSKRHPVVGVDVSSQMLRVARRRLPGVRLVLQDMRTLRMNQQFDVVTCLFSAIGHLGSKRQVRQAFANFARLLTPGGVVIVEPWIEPSIFRAGTVYLATHQGPGLIIARMAHSSRRGNHSRVHYHFLIGERGREIRYYDDVSVGLLLSRQELLALMRSAGLRSRWISPGLTPGRGLLIGVKPKAG
jgi:ubiquinone/menaquinone biosynthesis C-methylase UbiE